MKKLIIAVGIAAVAPLAFAQTSTTTEKTTSTDGTTTTQTTTTRGMGTVTTFTPGETLVVKETAGPVTYKLGKKVVYVTKAGKTIEHSMIKPGANVEVVYDKSGSDMVVERVIVDQ